jgi:hypothetical protein
MAEPTTTSATAAPAPMTARMEVTLKFTAIPETAPGPNGWRTFVLSADGRTFRVTVRPKIWNKLDEAAKAWPLWTAVIRGKLGSPTADGFELTDPSLEVFERKEKPPKEAAPAAQG